MQKHYDELTKLDTEIITVQREEREGVAGLKKTIQMTGIAFPVVIDHRNEETADYSQGAFFTYIIDTQGVIRAILPGTTYDRPTGDQIVAAFKQTLKKDE